jgi:hypothetical protein
VARGGDAQDRTLPVELDRIPDDKRRAEEELWEEFEYAHGRVLGAIFDALSRVLKERPGVKLDRRPRLADWGYYAAAAYEVFGWGSKRFEADWKAVVDAQNRETREGSALAQAIFEIMEVHDYYSATADKLLEALETEAEKLKIDTRRDKKWPNAPSWVYRRIKEVLPLLNADSVYAERGRDKKAREIVLYKGNGGDSIDDSIPADDSILGGFSPTLNSRGDEPESAPMGDPTPPPREVPRNAVNAVYGVTDEDDDEWEQF